MQDQSKYILTIKCPDTVGISATVSNFIYENEGFVTSAYHYGDPVTNRYFMRVVFKAIGAKLGSIEDIKVKFQPIAKRFSMDWQISNCEYKPRVLIAVSKYGHCLNDILHKTDSGLLPIDIVAVMSNHHEMKDLVEWHKINYYHLPVTPETKEQQEEKFINLVEGLRIDLVILARYMQILSPKMCQKLKEKCINIHHSFLPSFKGAAPYSQAHSRGVKIVGATAHYVTEDLDEGPIIEQAVERVDHTSSVEDIAMTVRDLETVVLSRAVKWHAERRILLNGHKTVVFK